MKIPPPKVPPTEFNPQKIPPPENSIPGSSTSDIKNKLSFFRMELNIKNIHLQIETGCTYLIR